MQQAGSSQAKPEAEYKREGTRLLGDTPRIKFQKILKPRSGDIRAMVLPGGGDLCLRMWAGIRRYIAALAGWLKLDRVSTPAFGFRIKLLNEFINNQTQHSKHAWSMLDSKQQLLTHGGLLHFLDFVQPLHAGKPHASKPLDYAEAGIAKLLTLLESHVD